MPVIGEGNYGCVFRPHVQCDGKKPKYNHAVGKVFVDQAYHDFEYQVNIDVIKKIDPDSSFTLPLYDACDIVQFQKKNAAADCTLIDKGKVQRYHQLIYKDGGHSLKEILRAKGSVTKLRSLVSKMRPILIGLHAIQKHGYVHQDIKPHNIMYDGKKLYIIDFGIMMKARNVYSPENMHVLKYDYPYYPPEYKLYALRQSNLSTFIAKVHSNFSFIFEIGGVQYHDLLNIINNDIGVVVKTELADAFIKRRKTDTRFSTEKIDLYSLGIVLLEMYLWSGLQNIQYKRDSKNKRFKDSLRQLIEGMIHFDVEKRFNTTEAIKAYDSISF